jgi:hypothetical protein
MMSDSKVDAPELFAKKAMLTIIKEEAEDVNEESDDRKAAAVRDVAKAMLHKIGTAKDGAGLTVGPGESGVRLVFYLGSVEKMNQSRHGITNLVTYKAAQHAESYETLQARCSSVRKQLCKIHNRQYIERPDGGRVYVRFMLTADKSGLCHMLGRRNMNYDAYGTQCDCKDSLDQLYDLTLGALTHFDGLSFEKRSARAHVAEWETREQDEPPSWTIWCDCCKKVRRPPRTPAHASPAERRHRPLWRADVHQEADPGREGKGGRHERRGKKEMG